MSENDLSSYEKSIKEEYDVEIIINDKYPDNLPSVKEIGHRIPRDFHQYKEDGVLCLGAPLDMKRQFNKKRTLLGFVENLIIPYLYSYSIKENKGIMPYGELSHGVEGILESYKELLGIDNDFVVLRFLKILSDGNYRGHIDCPCGSNKKLRNCHGNILIDIKNCRNSENYLCESIYIIDFMKKRGENITIDLMPKFLVYKIKKLK